MARHQTDILKQPIPTLMVTFGTLLTLLTMRALGTPFVGESAIGSLSPVGEWFDGTLGATWGAIVGVTAMLLSSIIITRITARYSLSVIRSFVPMVLFVVAACAVVYPIGSPSIMVAVLMIVHATELMIVSFKRTEQFGCVMRGSFWFGCAAMLSPDLIYVVALLPLQWAVWQRSPREMVASVLLALTPWLHASFGFWAFGGERFGWFSERWAEGLSTPHPISFAQLPEALGGYVGVAMLVAVTLLTLASVVVFVTGYGSMRIRARKGHIIFSALYFVGLAMLLGGVPLAIALPLMGIGAAPLIYTFFVKRKGGVSTIIYIGVVLLALAAAVVPLVA